MLTNTRIAPGTWWRCPWIEGYCSEMSVRAGDTLKIMVSTKPASEFSLEIFRTGYHGGDGGRSVMRFDSLPGKTQPNTPIGENRLRECQWEPSVKIEIPEDWVSGVYLGELTAVKEDLQSYVIFIVRDDGPCDLLFQCSDLTWHAYNSWPDDRWSLYHDDRDIYNRNGRKKWSINANDTGWVSFDRPYANFCMDHLVDRPSSVGSGEFLLWEFPLPYWLEQQGYDVSYISNVDTHTDGPGPLRAKGFISVGHDEYWTLDMYDNVSAARDTGVNLAFLSGNSVWGVVPLLPSSGWQANRIIRRHSVFVGEKAFEGVDEQMKKQIVSRLGDYPPGPDGARLMGGRMGRNSLGGGDTWVCTMPGHWLYDGTGIKEGYRVEGLVGWKWHAEPAMDLPGLEILASVIPVAPRTGKPKTPHSATIYDAPKGNVVFNAGTIWWPRVFHRPQGTCCPPIYITSPLGQKARTRACSG